MGDSMADYYRDNDDSFSDDDLDSIMEPEDDPGPEYFRQRAIERDEGILAMSEMADLAFEDSLWPDFLNPEQEQEEEEKELPPLPRYRSKRVLPKGLQKHSNKAFEIAVGIKRRKWYWLWTK
jgi:hypothetical protein